MASGTTLSINQVASQINLYSSQDGNVTAAVTGGNLVLTAADGSDITLSIGLSQPLYGTLSGGQLTLNVPQSDGSFQAGTCNHSSLSDWNSTVATLDSQAGSDNQAANQQAAQAQLQVQLERRAHLLDGFNRRRKSHTRYR